MKTIRVVLAGSAVAVGRRCAPFYEDGGPLTDIDRIFSSRHGLWMWEPRRERAVEVAIVDVPIDTLEPTDDGDPDELQLCEQAQREDRAAIGSSGGHRRLPWIEEVEAVQVTRSFRLGRRSSTLWLLGDVPTRAKLMSQVGRVAREYGCTVELQTDDGRTVYSYTATHEEMAHA